MRRTIALALLVTVIGFAGVVGAQTLTGTIAGKVTDEQGGVLPGVNITLTGRTGSQTQVTDARGEFRFLGLAPGTYAIKSELQGFRPKEQQGLEVSIGKTVDVTLPMTVGGLTETVDVVANAITIDTTTTKTDTNLSQDLLFSMPLSHNNPAVSILQYFPGVNDGSAFGGASDGANSLMLDGVDTRDPEGGTAWTFYNFNIIDQVQVGSLGQPAEYGGFTGVVVNTITKSGGNRFSHLSELRWTNDSMSSNNVTDEIIKQNATLSVPARVLTMKDYTVQLGGPLKKDKAFFFASIQRYDIEQKITGPLRSEISPRFNFKVTYQASPSDNFVASVQYDQYNQQGRTGLIPGYAVTSNAQTIDQDSPELVYNGQYRRTFGASTLFEAKYMGWWGYYDLNPVSSEPTHFDSLTSKYSGGAGYTGQYDRTRNQVNVSLSKYASYAGSHNFKFGAEIERSTIRDRFQYSHLPGMTQGVYLYDYGGAGYSAWGYSYDLQGKNSRDSFYAQDQWKMGRATLNLGVRADSVRGTDSATGTEIYSTFSAGPRLGAAFDLTGKGKSVIRGFYGQMYEAAEFSSWSRAATGLSPTTYYEVSADWKTLTPYDTVSRTYTAANDLKHPRVDEFNFAWEQQIGRSVKFTATGIWREWKNFINSVLPNGLWTPIPYATPPGWTGASTLPLYKWANGTSVPQFTIVNTDTVNYTLSNGQTLTVNGDRKYKGLMLVLERAYRNRWQARISYVLSKTDGTIGNGTYAGISSSQFETPNTIAVNADGPTAYDRRHEVKIFAGYQIPKIEVSVNGGWTYLSGWPYAANFRISGSSTKRLYWPSTITVNLDPPGSHMNDNQTNLDLRLEKVVKVGINRFGLYFDIANALNELTVLSRQARFPDRTLSCPGGGDPNVCAPGADVVVAFGDPLTVTAGRQLTLGLRWSF
jgi:hypothetical protein